MFMRAFAEGKLSFGTSRGTSDLIAGIWIAHKDACSVAITYRTQRCGCPSSALNASTPESTASAVFVRSMRVRRSMESAIAPPTTDRVNRGTSAHRPSKPTAREEWLVRLNTWNGIATAVMWDPMSEIESPIQSSRNCGDSRSGERSMSRLRARPNIPGDASGGGISGGMSGCSSVSMAG